MALSFIYVTKHILSLFISFDYVIMIKNSSFVISTMSSCRYDLKGKISSLTAPEVEKDDDVTTTLLLLVLLSMVCMVVTELSVVMSTRLLISTPLSCCMKPGTNMAHHVLERHKVNGDIQINYKKFNVKLLLYYDSGCFLPLMSNLPFLCNQENF